MADYVLPPMTDGQSILSLSEWIEGGQYAGSGIAFLTWQTALTPDGLAGNVNNNGERFTVLDLTDPGINIQDDDVEVLMRIGIDAPPQRFNGIMLRASLTQNTGMRLRLEPGSGASYRLACDRKQNGATFQCAADLSVGDLSGATEFWLWFKVEGNAYEAKVWEVGQPEPGVQRSFNDVNIATGTHGHYTSTNWEMASVPYMAVFEVTNVGGSVPLAPADATTSALLESPGITEGVLLNPAGMVSTAFLDSPALTEAAQLAPTDLGTAATVDSPALTEAAELAPAGIGTSSTVDTPAITVGEALAPAPLATGALLDSPAVTEAAQLAPDPLATSALLDQTSINTGNEWGGPTYDEVTQVGTWENGDWSHLDGDDTFTIPWPSGANAAAAGDVVLFHVMDNATITNFEMVTAGWVELGQDGASGDRSALFMYRAAGDESGTFTVRTNMTGAKAGQWSTCVLRNVDQIIANERDGFGQFWPSMVPIDHHQLVAHARDGANSGAFPAGWTQLARSTETGTVWGRVGLKDRQTTNEVITDPPTGVYNTIVPAIVIPTSNSQGPPSFRDLELVGTATHFQRTGFEDGSPVSLPWPTGDQTPQIGDLVVYQVQCSAELQGLAHDTGPVLNLAADTGSNDTHTLWWRLVDGTEVGDPFILTTSTGASVVYGGVLVVRNAVGITPVRQRLNQAIDSPPQGTVSGWYNARAWAGDNLFVGTLPADFVKLLSPGTNAPDFDDQSRAVLGWRQETATQDEVAIALASGNSQTALSFAFAPEPLPRDPWGDWKAANQIGSVVPNTGTGENVYDATTTQTPSGSPIAWDFGGTVGAILLPTSVRTRWDLTKDWTFAAGVVIPISSSSRDLLSSWGAVEGDIIIGQDAVDRFRFVGPGGGAGKLLHSVAGLSANFGGQSMVVGCRYNAATTTITLLAAGVRTDGIRDMSAMVPNRDYTFGARPGGSQFWGGDGYGFKLWDRAISDAEFDALTVADFQGGSGVVLTPGTLATGALLTTPPITEDTLLSPNSLTTAATLAAAQIAEAVQLTPGSLLTAALLDQADISEAVTLTPDRVATVGQLDETGIATGTAILPDDLTAAATLAVATIIEGAQLSPATLATLTELDSPPVTEDLVIAPAGLNTAALLESPVVLVGGVLYPSDLTTAALLGVAAISGGVIVVAADRVFVVAPYGGTFAPSPSGRVFRTTEPGG